MRHLFVRLSVVGALGLVLFIAARLVSQHDGDKRLASAIGRADEACRAFRAEPGQAEAHVCNVDAFGPLTYKIRDRGSERVAEGKRALARGESRVAASELAAAMAEVRTLNRHGTTGAAMAAEIVVDVLDALDAGAARLDGAEILSDVELQASTRPFESWRVHRMWSLSRYPEMRYADAPDLSASEIADLLEHGQRMFEEMDAATTAGDTARCERAARGADPMFLGPQVNVSLCGKMANVVHVGKRLRAARRAASESRER